MVPHAANKAGISLAPSSPAPLDPGRGLEALRASWRPQKHVFGGTEPSGHREPIEIPMRTLIYLESARGVEDGELTPMPIRAKLDHVGMVR